MEYLDKEVGKGAFLKDLSSFKEIKDGDNGSVISLFDKLSHGYDLHMEEANHPIQQTLVDTLSDQIEIDQNLNKNCSILDVACGTGQVGQLLRKAGFTGNIEGLDGSKGMLNKAKHLENVYNNLHHEVLTPNHQSNLLRNNYNVVIIAYAFYPNYIGAEHIETLLDFLHVDGLCLFNLNYDLVDEPTDLMMRYVAGIDAKIRELVEKGKCVQLVGSDVDGISPRLDYVNPMHGGQDHTEFIHERKICLKKL